MSAIGEMPSCRPRLDVLPFLSEPRRREFLRDFSAMDDEGARGNLLRAALPFLGSPLRPEWSAALLEAARSVRTTAVRAELLAAFLPHLDGSERGVVLAEVLDAIRRLGGRQDRVRVVRQITELLSGSERGALLASLLEVNRTRGWVDVNDRILEPLDLSASLAPGIDPSSRRAPLLEALGEVQTHAVRLRPNLQDELARALKALAPCLAEPPLEDVRREALAVARSISKDEHYFKPLGVDARAHALMALLPVLHGPERNDLARELFEVAREMPDDRWRTLAFKDLVTYLDEDQHRDL